MNVFELLGGKKKDDSQPSGATNPPVAAELESPSNFSEISNATLSKHLGQGNEKRGRGRPKRERDAEGNIIRNTPSNTANIPQAKIQSKSVPSAPVTPPVDREMVESALKAICETVDGVVVRKVFRTAFQVTKNKMLSEQLSGDAGMKIPEQELIAKLGAVVMEKHQILGAHAPEVLLGITLCGYTVRTMMVLNKLKSIQMEQKIHDDNIAKQQRQATVPPSATVENKL
jgi:hypothetical protein